MWFGGRLIGVVHLLPLPGSPGFSGSMDAILDRASRDAAAYAKGGADAVIVENYGDTPFEKDRLPPETVAALTLCARAVADVSGSRPLGINALRNDARAALGIAAAVGAAFVRVNVHAGVVATDQGLIEGRAAETLRLRRAWGIDTRIAADVHVKHGKALHCDDIAQAARDLRERGGADAIVVSGPATGAVTELDDLAAVRAALPDAILMVGSGVTAATVADVLRYADALIVGTALKADGKTDGLVEVGRVARIADAVRRAPQR